MSSSLQFETIQPLVQAFSQSDLPYYIGGSVGSSHYGIPRTTLDTDIVVRMQIDHVDPLCHSIGPFYYHNDEAIRQAVIEKKSFNLIHLQTMQKIDIFILKDQSYDQQAFARRRKDQLDPVDDKHYYVASPEDIILHKLHWYKLGGEVSERQWTDVLGVLRVQADALDEAYLNKWAAELQVDDLLKKIRRQAADS